MRISVNRGSAAMIASFNILMSIMNEMVKLNPQYCRTVVIIFENGTCDVAADVHAAMDAYNAPIISINLDRNETIRRNWERRLGEHFFNICVLKNITNPTMLEKLYAHMVFGSRHYYFSLIIQRAERHEIDAFFRQQFQHTILKSAACFLGESIDIYTQFPYQQQFAVKIHEIHRANQTRPSNLFARLFFRKDDNLSNATMKVFISENIPKVFRLPSRYRLTSSKFYFVGRDGYMAKKTEELLCANWKYISMSDSYLTKITHFVPNSGAANVDLFGKRTKFDDDFPQSLTYVNLSEIEPIS